MVYPDQIIADHHVIMNKITIGLVVVLVCMGITIGWQHKRINAITKERNVYKNNAQALMSDIEELHKDSHIQAYKRQTLTLNLEEYKKYRSDDARVISDLKLKLKQLSAVAKQEMKVDISIEAPVKDSVIIADATIDTIQNISYKDQYVSFDGNIQHDSLKAHFHVPVTITQALYKVPKHKFLWWTWGCKAVNQVIITNNPYVQLNYSEYIEIK